MNAYPLMTPGNASMALWTRSFCALVEIPDKLLIPTFDIP